MFTDFIDIGHSKNNKKNRQIFILTYLSVNCKAKAATNAELSGLYQNTLDCTLLSIFLKEGNVSRKYSLYQ